LKATLGKKCKKQKYPNISLFSAFLCSKALKARQAPGKLGATKMRAQNTRFKPGDGKVKS